MPEGWAELADVQLVPLLQGYANPGDGKSCAPRLPRCSDGPRYCLPCGGCRGMRERNGGTQMAYALCRRPSEGAKDRTGDGGAP